MKEIKLYQCSKCNAQYKSRQDCKKCESAHKNPIEIISERYVPYKNNERGYPIGIIVKMSDGERVEYKR